MPDQSQSAQERDAHSDDTLPIGIPLTAVIAILFLFGSTLFNSTQKSFDVAAPRLSTESSTN